MCGIFGIYKSVQSSNACCEIKKGLLDLEYRGYDSCGISIANNGQIQTVKTIGSVSNLETKQSYPLQGYVGIGHTRWATHGKINITNTQPICLQNISVVHNGIVENTTEILNFLNQNNVKHKYSNITSDTTLLPALISYTMRQNGNNFCAGFFQAHQMLKGNSAIVALYGDKNAQIAIASKGASVYIGKSKNNISISSDLFTLSQCQEIYKVGEEETLLIHNSVKSDKNTNNQIRVTKITNIQAAFLHTQQNDVIFNIKKQNDNTSKCLPSHNKHTYKHITRQEIQEQTEILKQIMQFYVNKNEELDTNNIPQIKKPKEIKKINFIASGSSYNAGFIISKIIEDEIDIETSCYFGSEFAYCHPNAKQNSKIQELCVFISQSGETMDSIVSVKRAKWLGMKVLCILNTKDNTMAEMADYKMFCEGKKEIGVAATKSFSSQIMSGLFFMLSFCSQIKAKNTNEIKQEIKKLQNIPTVIVNTIMQENEIQQIAEKMTKAKFLHFIGRGLSFGLSLEGSLKAKELSYIPSEPLFGGELKHGHLAVVSKNVWCVCPLLDNKLTNKSIGNINEIIVRKGNVLIISSNKIDIANIKNYTNCHCVTADVNNNFELIFSIIVTQQLLAYHIAAKLNREIDKPRNLAKSITVE
ncbi:MAG: glutamine--fructose-6-phosphate transaminase (isomerizing) [Alphaproteobacteria bacterium]|nr:glutamine--fructose-6-phosphate transaminase (isomerizing) [Rickettsiales bacterium]